MAEFETNPPNSSQDISQAPRAGDPKIVFSCMECEPGNIGQLANAEGDKISHGYHPECGLLYAAKYMQSGLEEGDKRKIDSGRRMVISAGERLTYSTDTSETTQNRALQELNRALDTVPLQEAWIRRAA